MINRKYIVYQVNTEARPSRRTQPCKFCVRQDLWLLVKTGFDVQVQCSDSVQRFFFQIKYITFISIKAITAKQNAQKYFELYITCTCGNYKLIFRFIVIA